MTAGDIDTFLAVVLSADFPERATDPRDDRTGWERGEAQLCRQCNSGRVLVTADACAWCAHGLTS